MRGKHKAEDQHPKAEPLLRDLLSWTQALWSTWSCCLATLSVVFFLDTFFLHSFPEELHLAGMMLRGKTRALLPPFLDGWLEGDWV